MLLSKIFGSSASYAPPPPTLFPLSFIFEAKSGNFLEKSWQLININANTNTNTNIKNYIYYLTEAKIQIKITLISIAHIDFNPHY